MTAASAWTDARACVGGTCVPLLSVAESGWREFLSKNARLPPHCPRRLRGCPWKSCTSKNKCVSAGAQAPVPCRDRRTSLSGVQPCYMMEMANSTRSLDSVRAPQCSGSLSEEQFVLHQYFGGRRPRRGGVFLELGAFDGLMESNTLHLESCLGWTGLLLDAPTHLQWMNTNRPGALTVGLAVCPEAGLVNYSSQRTTTAGIVSYMSRSLRWRFRVAQAGQELVACAPLAALLALFSVRHIDFFSLECARAAASHRLLVCAWRTACSCVRGWPPRPRVRSTRAGQRARRRAHGTADHRLARAQRRRARRRVQGPWLPRPAGRGSARAA